MISNPFFPQFRKYGTNTVIALSNEAGVLPNRNFQNGTYEKVDAINGEAQRSQAYIRELTCWGCPLACYMQVKIRKDAEIIGHSAEYETTAMIGSNLELSSANDLLYANHLCNDLGLDTITTGSVLAFATECYQRGIITEKETGGLKLEWGNDELYHKLIRMIAYREGIGNDLAEGIMYLAQKWNAGSEEFAVQVKGMEVSAYDSRAAPAMALSYMTCDLGGHHNRSWAIKSDLEMGRKRLEGKPEVVIDLQHRRPLLDQLGVCRFPWVEVNLNYDYYAKFYNAVTGESKSTEELLRISERVWNLTRCLWIREKKGFGRNDDYPPKRWFNPFISGKDPTEGQHLSQRDVEWLLDRYYDLRGWDRNGRPTKSKLLELGLDDVADILSKLGLIS
jgi:aldehyde:ferredoxin oxidoreductase